MRSNALHSSEIDFFYLGPPKTASTWLFECLKKHPEICATDHSETNFFDIHFNKGESWYDKLFPDTARNQNLKKIDCTPTYINSVQAMERLLTHSPNAKFAVGIRNPVERAFSGYWHVKRTRQINYKFSDILDTYVWFRAWVEPGLISAHLAWLYDRVGRDHVLPIYFEDVKDRPLDLLQDVYRFIDINTNFTPDALNKPVNKARPKTDIVSRALNKSGLFSGKAEYLNGIDPVFRKKLNGLVRPEVEALSELLEKDLSQWLIS